MDKDNENNEYEVSVEIYIPSTCIVSRYQLTVLTEFEERNVVKELTHEYDKDVYILFNPWCEGKKFSVIRVGKHLFSLDHVFCYHVFTNFIFEAEISIF